MAQTRITAKNTFGEGLIMDFAPDNTQANVLTNALNATLLTYNGNEMSLQNDMGNGRVETAFLPEGYIPMGTCEFGGIIYIVSYNPQDDLCQIGSFPSPERNITKEDRLDTDLQVPSLDRSYFQELEGGQPTGKLNSLVSKVIIKEDNLNPGDKYIVTGRAQYSKKDTECLSGLFNDDPKRVKLSVVSIEDSGKITKLNTINYNVNVAGYGNTLTYNIANSDVIDNLAKQTDIDAYRKTLSQNYSVFDSKVPGKLAILAELEVINTFSCGHRVLTSSIKEGTVEYIKYDVYLDYKWEADNPKINPKYLTITKFDWKSNLTDQIYGYDKDGKELKILTNYNSGYQAESTWRTDATEVQVWLPQLVFEQESKYYHTLESIDYIPLHDQYEYRISTFDSNHKRTLKFIDSSVKNGSTMSLEVGRDIGELEVNNELGLSNTTYLCTIMVPNKFNTYSFKLPYKLQYQVTPAMDFGMLDHLAIDNEIDFSLIGTKLIQPAGIKYFASQDFLTLSINSKIYEEENHKVTKVAVEFYDYNGFCGTYIFDNRESYTGNLVANIPFNSIYLSKTKYNSKDLWKHDVSAEDSKSTNIITTNEEDTGDCGILYYNLIYGAKLIYEYSTLDPLTQDIDTTIENGIEYITKGFWIYTDGQFNDNYYSSDDFSTIKPHIPLKYAYRISDGTKKSNVHLDSDTENDLQQLLNANEDTLNKLQQKIEYLTTYADYSGEFNLEVSMGIDKNSIYGLMQNSKGLQVPKIKLNLVNPYNLDETYGIIEQSSEDTSSQENEDEEIPLMKEYSYNKKASKFELQGTTNFDEIYKNTSRIIVDLPEIPFNVRPFDFKKQLIHTKIMTPILYARQKDDYNYDEVGGKTMFKKSLCYVGSDDDTSSEKGHSDDRWYETYINDTGRTTDSLLYEYPSGSIHTNIMEGHENLYTYYNSLGNRQPLTLFTIQRPEPDPEAPESIGYSVKWTVNVEGLGYVWTHPNDDTGYKYLYDVPGPAQEVIYKQKGNGASEYSPKYTDRSYLPAFVDERIATGGTNVVMASGGGAVPGANDKIYYTAHTSQELRTSFYKSYLQTLKELITVNPEVTQCEIGTFTYNEDQCKNLEALSVITAEINDGDQFKLNAPKLIAIHEYPFETYISEVCGFVNSNGSLLTPEDPNVAVEFDLQELGENQPVTITYINYVMQHEHELIDDYLNQENQTLIQFANGYFDFSTKQFKENWGETLYKTQIPIDDAHFYMLIKDSKSKFDLKKVTLLDQSVDRYGHINWDPWSGVLNGTPKGEVTDVWYKPPQRSIFYNTTMCIDDFKWDPENKKHHFYFTGESNLAQVAAPYSFQLDDDYGVKKDRIIARPYYIGPSFVSKFY